MRMKSKEFLDKEIYADDMKIGKVKEFEIDTEDWKVTHLQIELTKDAAQAVLGVKKGGVRNTMATSALKKGMAIWGDKGLDLKVSKDQLHIYLRPVNEV